MKKILWIIMSLVALGVGSYIMINVIGWDGKFDVSTLSFNQKVDIAEIRKGEDTINLNDPVNSENPDGGFFDNIWTSLSGIFDNGNNDISLAKNPDGSTNTGTDTNNPLNPATPSTGVDSSGKDLTGTGLKKQQLTLTGCVDGDTAKFKEIQGGYVRFLIIDTPEYTKTKEPYGQEAAQFTCSRLQDAKYLEGAYDPASSKIDNYGRALMYIWADGELINHSLAKNGLIDNMYLKKGKTLYYQDAIIRDHNDMYGIYKGQIILN